MNVLKSLAITLSLSFAFTSNDSFAKSDPHADSHDVFLECSSSQEACEAACNAKYPNNTGARSFKYGESCYDPKTPYTCGCYIKNKSKK